MISNRRQLDKLFFSTLDPVTSEVSWHVEYKNRVLTSYDADVLWPAASMIKTGIAHAAGYALIRGDVGEDDLVTVDEGLFSAGDGILKSLPAGGTLSFAMALTLAISASDNWATNVVLDHLGGPAAVNDHLHRAGLDAAVLRYLGGVHRDQAQPTDGFQPPRSPDEWGIGAISPRSHSRLLYGLLASEEVPGWLRRAFGNQQDRRSLGRSFVDEAPLWWKTGTVSGFHHAGGLLRKGDGDTVSVAIFTESADAVQRVDHPACRAIDAVVTGLARQVGASEWLVPAAP